MERLSRESHENLLICILRDWLWALLLLLDMTLSLVQLCESMDCGTQDSLSITRAGSDSRPLSQWCHPTISSSVVRFSCLLSFPASEVFPVSQFFASSGQSIGASAPASVLQGWFPLGLTSWISLHSEGLSRVFSNTTVQKHQFFSAQSSLWSSSENHTWL